MNIGVLGTGTVGQTIASRLIEVGHQVMLGARTETNPKAADWVGRHPERAVQGTFAQAARFGDLLFVCTRGEHTITALEAAGTDALANKVVIDVTNPMAFSSGIPHQLPAYTNTTSLAEQIQKTFPAMKLVKSLNTMWGGLMANPNQLREGDHTVFMSSDWPEAKAAVRDILQQFGWRSDNILDLGDITTARGPEMFVALWLRLRLSPAINSHLFSIKVVTP